MRIEHEIFHRPHKINIVLEDHATPKVYRKMPGGEQLGDTIKVWRVHSWKDWSPLGLGELSGLVSTPWGFTDSPDAEVISYGLNHKAPDAVAIGRHGNFLAWGFNSPPSRMTPEFQKCFVNAVCYIAKFDGQKPLVHRVNMGREVSIVLARQLQWNSVFLNNDGYMNSRFPERLQRQFGKNAAAYAEHYSANLEYVRRDGKLLEIDEDVKRIGVSSNRDIRLLQTCVTMLEQQRDVAIAKRLLERYTTESFKTPAEWRTWLEANRQNIFFTDVGGYKFMVAPASNVDSDEANKRKGTVFVPEPTDTDPVQAAMEVRPPTAKPGDIVTVVVRMRTAPSWYVYAHGGSQQGTKPTALSVASPSIIQADGDCVYPKAVVDKGNGKLVYRDDFVLTQRLRVSPSAKPGDAEIVCTVAYQTCNVFKCRVPTSKKLRARIHIE